MSVGYYDQEFEPWARGIRSIGQAIAQAPLLRAQAQERQQRSNLMTAQIGAQQASGRKSDAETAILIKKGQLVTALENSAPQAQQDIANGLTDTEAVRTFSGAASALTGVNGDDIVKSAREGIGTLLGRMGKVTEAASVENPVELEKARIASSRGQVVQPGGALVKDGKVVFQNPSAASQQAGEYQETIQEYPAVEATEGTPAQPAKTHWFKADEPAKDAVPGTPYKPKTVVKTRRKLGDVVATAPAANQSQDPDDSDEQVEEPAGMEDDGQTQSAQPTAARSGLNIPRPATFGVKKLDAATAKAILDEVGGDKKEARKLAVQRGYSF